MTGLTLGHVMTPLRVDMTTVKPAAKSDNCSPNVNITSAEISQLADDVTSLNDDGQSVDHEINNQRFAFIKYFNYLLVFFVYLFIYVFIYPLNGNASVDVKCNAGG